jgi:hypothetical protein
MNWVELTDGGLLVSKGVTIEVEKAGRGMAAMISTEVLDTDGDIIRQAKSAKGPGWDLADFNAMPFMTWGHDKSRPNIASPDVRAHVRAHKSGSGAALWLDPFAFDPGDKFAQEVQGKYERKVLKQTSVGFRSKNFEPLDGGGREYFGQKLIETAAVNLGANQETDTLIKSMLTRTGLVAKVESGGDSEVEALKIEVQYLRDELRLISNVVKLHGDKLFCGQDERDAVEPRAQLMEATIKVMADNLLTRLQKIGTAQ